MAQTFNIPEITEVQFLGYNDKDAIHLLPKGYFVKADNVFVTDNKITKVNGSSSIASSIASYAFNGFASFERYAAGTKYLVVNINGASNSQLYSWNGSGTFSSIGTANITNNHTMNFVVANDTLFGFNGVEVVTWNGTTYTKNPTSVPIGNYSQWFHGYLWVANTSSFPNRLYWSNLGQPTSFAGGISSVAVNAGGTGYQIGDVLNIKTSNSTSGTGGKVIVTGVSGGVTGVTIAAGGTGYTVNDVISITTDAGTSATLKVTAVATGVITAVSITAAGTGYVAGYTVNGTGGTGSGATFTITNVSSAVTSISIYQAGSGYSTGTAFSTTSTLTSGAGSGLTVDINTVDTTTVNNFVDVNAGDSDQITALSTIQDELLVFKRNTIWSVAGWAADSFSSTNLTSSNLNARIFGYGAVNQGSVISVGNDVYYFSMLGNVPVIRSLKKTINAVTLAGGVVSDMIRGTLSNITLSALSKITSAFDGRYIYWAIPVNSSTTNNKIICLDTWKMDAKRGIYPFTTMTGKNVSFFANSTISGGTSTVFFTDAGTTGLVFKFDSSVYTDNGTSIKMDVVTRGYMGHPSRKTHWKYLYVKTDQGVNSTLDINSKFDSAVNFTLQDAISLAGNSPGLGPTGTFTLGVSFLGGATLGYNRVNFAQQVGRIFQIEFTETSSNAVTIYEYSLYGNVKGLRQ